MIEFTTDPHGDIYVGRRQGDATVSHTKELLMDDGGVSILVDYGHDGKLIGIEILGFHDEEQP